MQMTDHHSPELSIGLPVFNGDNFLEDALDSILKQDFSDFELIVSDNASTDRTESICRAYAEKDSRVRYFRNHENIGAAGNWNRVFELSSGQFFKWIAHDDMHEPEFVSRCIDILERDPSAVLAFTKAITVDAQGKFIREWSAHPEICSVDVRVRYRRWLAAAEDPLPLPIFGVVRSDVLRRTRLFTGYPESDIALLTELSLHGRFSEVREPLFIQREHGQRAGPKLARNPHLGGSFWNPRKDQQLRFPHWRLLAGHIAALRSVPLLFRDRKDCLLALVGWVKRNMPQLSDDLIRAAASLPAIGQVVESIARKLRAMAWRRKVAHAARDLKSLIPPSATYILVDDESFGREVSAGQNVRPFLEREGGCWGPPPDDETAVSELERMRAEGAAYLVFGWPCFWWLTYYKGFATHLNKNYSLVLENSRLLVFDLHS